jgi:hypothetical protein
VLGPLDILLSLLRLDPLDKADLSPFRLALSNGPNPTLVLYFHLMTEASFEILWGFQAVNKENIEEYARV